MRSAVAAAVLAAGCAALLPGCYTIGNKRITDEKLLAKLEKGKSTKADVEKLLGLPAVTDFAEGGTLEKWVYTYSKAQVRGTSFIPIAGSFVGGSDVRTDVLTVLFDDAGVVKNVGRGQTLGGGGGLQDAARDHVSVTGDAEKPPEPARRKTPGYRSLKAE